LIVSTKTGERQAEIEFFRRQHGRCVLKFRGIDSIEAAEEIVGCEIGIRRQDLLAPEDGSFYTFQLKGCAVFDGPEFIGTVTGVLDSGGADVLQVHRDHEETLIPFAQSFLKKIDLERRRIDVELPEGLRDINK